MNKHHADGLALHYHARAIVAGVPENLIGGFIRYIINGIPPGDFLQAVLSNDLNESLGRADMQSRACIFQITSFVHNDVPSIAWGDRATVIAWINHRGLMGREDRGLPETKE